MADKKLQALDKTYEIQEQEAVCVKKKVDSIFESRLEAVEKLKKDKSILLEQLESLRRNKRRDALINGQTWMLSSISAIEKKILNELGCLEPSIKQAEKELDTAMQRGQLVSNALKDVQIERKKIERLVDNTNSRKKAEKTALDEIAIEELSANNKTQDRLN